VPDLLRDQLQTTLGAGYTLGRELGGGGMSRVYVAHEEALGRNVVVKLLAPELAAGVSAERFAREIRLAAALQEPHIVPVLTAGVTAEGLPWYTMPFVAGESLRARLEQARTGGAGPLPLSMPQAEAVGILRDLLAALDYAHAHGIVHRDVKPENVLLSGRTAVVTDFGIAKALQVAKTAAPEGPADASTGALTRAGMSLGTPAYMAPEQAMGDPATDHRADLYAWGVVAYELLAGRHPFAGRTSPHALVAAHLTEAPLPLPAAVPPALAALVRHTLAKAPEDRPASAAAVLAALDAARDEAVRESGRAAALADALPTRAVVLRALAVYAVVVALVAVGTPRLMDAFGLPDWVLPGAFGLAVLGLPLLLLALWVRHQAHAHAAAPDPSALSRTATFAVQARPHLRLKRVAWGGAATFAAFALLVGGWMTLRALGVGPAGSLFAAGTLAVRDTLVVADFRVAGPDTALGPVVAEAVRADLAQSEALSVAPVSRVVAALRRMERDPAQPFGEALARDVAQREGMKAVVTGELTPLGVGYVVTLRLLGAASGDVLASFRETADGPGTLIPTVERLTRALRGKVGESLTAVRTDPALDRVTTASLPALRKYTAANHAGDAEGDYVKAAALHREAIALDSTFAGAYRGLAIALGNLQIDPVGRDSAYARAYRYRDRLTERERLGTTAVYFHVGPGQDRRRAAAAYEAQLALDSTNAGALGNYGLLLTTLREFARAEALLRRGLALRASPGRALNLVIALIGQGRFAAAESTLAAARTRWPDAGPVQLYAILSAVDQRMLDSAVLRAERLLAANADPTLGSGAAELLAVVALERGQPALAERRLGERRAFLRAAGDPDAPLADAVRLARADQWTRAAPSGAVARLNAAFAAYPAAAARTVEEQRAALGAAALYAAAGAPARAQAVLASVEGAADSAARRRLAPERTRVRAELALAAGQGAAALRLFRASDVAADGGPATDCATCVLPDLARAAERAGWPDSARGFWTRFAEEPAWYRNEADQWHLARAYQRLGELWSDAGDDARAARYEARFVALRERAEPALQAEVAAVRQRLVSRPRQVRAGEAGPRR
jgi:tRNA A-37 threonylcarbamoyl transferase component Bud32/Tfp pilus assembly protein PilF